MDPARVAGFSRVFGMGNAYDADHVAKLLLQTAFRHLDAYQKVVQQVAWRRCWQPILQGFHLEAALLSQVPARLGRRFSVETGAFTDGGRQSKDTRP